MTSPLDAAPRANPLRQTVKRALSGALPAGLFLTAGPADSALVALTFDDGPHPVHTPLLLDALRTANVRATFFVVGRAAERHPDLVRRMADEGHDVGHHSYFHTEPALTFATDLLDEARRTAALLEQLTGKPPSLFRPPYGKLTPAKLGGLWLQRQSIVLWNVDPRDYACASADALAAWFAAHPLKGGDIVLLHDVHPFATGALPELVREAEERGLRFAPISTWTGRV